MSFTPTQKPNLDGYYLFANAASNLKTTPHHDDENRLKPHVYAKYDAKPPSSPTPTHATYALSSADTCVELPRTNHACDQGTQTPEHVPKLDKPSYEDWAAHQHSVAIDTYPAHNTGSFVANHDRSVSFATESRCPENEPESGRSLTITNKYRKKVLSTSIPKDGKPVLIAFHIVPGRTTCEQLTWANAKTSQGCTSKQKALEREAQGSISPPRAEGGFRWKKVQLEALTENQKAQVGRLLEAHNKHEMIQGRSSLKWHAISIHGQVHCRSRKPGYRLLRVIIKKDEDRY